MNSRNRSFRAKTISDEQILAMINSGEIVVNLKEAKIYKGSRELKATIVGSEESNGTRYRVEICKPGKTKSGKQLKRTILRSRLVYMAGTREVIPPAVEIHHLDDDRYNDAFSNLIKLTEQDHEKIHGQFKYPEDEEFTEDGERPVESEDEVPF